MVRLAHLDALLGVGRTADAEQALLDARTWLLRRAELIADPSVRRGFLERHPDHAEIIQRAAALRGGGAW